MRKVVVFLLKLAFAAGILTWLIIRADIKRENFADVPVYCLIGAAVCLMIQIALTSIRWYALLRCIGIRLPFPEVFSLAMQGVFFTLFIPAGSVGGDLIKAGILAKRAEGGQKFNGVFSIFMDRLCGLLGLVSFTLLSCLVYLPVIRTFSAGLRFSVYMVMLACVSVYAAAAAVFFYDFLYRVKGLGKLLALMDRYSKGAFSHAAEAVASYRKKWGILLFWVLATTFVFFPFLTASLCFLGYGVCGGKLNFPVCILASNLSQTIAAVPLTNGGIGTRDYAAQRILEAGGMPLHEASLIPLLYTAVFLLVSLSGAFFFIFDSFIRGRRACNLAEKSYNKKESVPGTTEE